MYVVASVKVSEDMRVSDANIRLHFCLLENAAGKSIFLEQQVIVA